MTVAKLIAELQKLNPDTPVEVDDGAEFWPVTRMASLPERPECYCAPRCIRPTCSSPAARAVALICTDRH